MGNILIINKKATLRKQATYGSNKAVQPNNRFFL